MCAFCQHHRVAISSRAATSKRVAPGGPAVLDALLERERSATQDEQEVGVVLRLGALDRGGVEPLAREEVQIVAAAVVEVESGESGTAGQEKESASPDPRR